MFSYPQINLEKRLLIYTFLFLSCVGYSQSNASFIIDSLGNDVELCKKKGEGLANAYLQLGNQYIRHDEFSKAIPILDKAYEVGLATQDSTSWVTALGSKGYAYHVKGEPTLAFEYLLKGMHAADSLEMKVVQARFLFLIGDCFRFQRQKEAAIEYLEKAGRLYEELQMTREWCRNYLFPLAGTYYNMQTDEADQKALALYHQMLSEDCAEHFNEFSRALVYNNLGNLYTFLKDYPNAEKNILKALTVFRKEKNKVSIASSLVNLAVLNVEQKKLLKAKQYIEEAYEIGMGSEDIHVKFDIVKYSSIIHRELGNYKEAIEFMSHVNNLRDSVETKDRIEAIAELELKYQTKQKEQEILNQELAIKNQELNLVVQQNRIKNILGLGALLFAIGIGFFSWYRSRFKRKEAEAKNLEHLDQLKTRYFTNISHELRTPLSLIIDPLSQLKKKNHPPEQEQQLIQSASKNAERMLHLVNQMLDLSKLEANKLPLKTQARDLKLNLSVIVDSFKNHAKKRKIDLYFVSEPDELEVYIDPDKIEKIISNLLANAFKFTKEGGKVSLLLLKRNQHAEILVKDTGTGIPADKLPFIFDRFYQVDDSETRSFQGTGIGLSLVKELVELHHGTITVKSQEGQGTQITIQLPLGKKHLKTSEIINTTQPSIEVDQREKTVHLIGENTTVISPQVSSTNIQNKTAEKPILLVVEDHQDLREYIVQQFQADYQILQADNGIEGVEVALERVPDLIISDVMMPGMNGYDLCERIKKDERSAHIPIILLTAKSMPEDKLHGLRKQADDYLNKPFDSEELRVRASNLITQRKQLRAKFSPTTNISPKDITVNSVDQTFLENLLEIIEENMSNEKFGVEEMSKAIGMSRSQLHRKLKALTGQNSSIFLRSIRLKRAYQLLEQSAGTASEIAFQVGFNNTSYFFKCFKEAYSVTPGQVLNGETIK